MTCRSSWFDHIVLEKTWFRSLAGGVSRWTLDQKASTSKPSSKKTHLFFFWSESTDCLDFASLASAALRDFHRFVCVQFQDAGGSGFCRRPPGLSKSNPNSSGSGGFHGSFPFSQGETLIFFCKFTVLSPTYFRGLYVISSFQMIDGFKWSFNRFREIFPRDQSKSILELVKLICIHYHPLFISQLPSLPGSPKIPKRQTPPHHRRLCHLVQPR